MGIPKFFRWISERYPLVNQMFSEADPPEFDNLYLDMNGIIHHCSHPFEDSTKNVLTEKDMFISVVHYVDRLLHIVKPRKLLYLAIDGVAPRAKMNQQRQRRFRSARDAAEALAELEAKGQPLPKDKPFDSNCITPGTEFMHTLSAHLQFFIRKKISEDNRWKKIKVIFSGHDVPGEGEHKIMEYIRHKKAQPDWDPNQTHCLYGLDADLIMLALASHEPHFALLREDVLTKQKKGNRTKITGETSQNDLQFHLFHLSLVREYLDLEYSKLTLDFPYSLERVIDDFILMCFFVGNDFLPHMAHLDIAEGGLNTMLTLYKTVLPSLGGYLVDDSEIQWARVEQFLIKLGEVERKLMEGVPLGDFFEDEKANNDIENEKEFNDVVAEDDETGTPVVREKALEKMILESNTEEEQNIDFEWKDQYYKEKFKVPSADARNGEFASFHRQLRQSYVEGLTWVMKYYFRGCQSWEWFYPYYYAPLASDLVQLTTFEVKFNMATPYTPYQQLLGVLPAASSGFLPPPYRELMISPTSPIIDFYPIDFQIDMAGKKNAWEGIVLVPFIDQARLLAACATIDENSLTQVEKDRNKLGYAHELIHDDKSHGRWASPAPYLTDIQDCHISSIPHVLPPLSPDAHPFHLLPGTKTGKHAPSGFPTLQTSDFTPTYVHAKVNIFGFPSKHENLVLKLPDPDLHTAEAVAAKLVGTRCYVNWPYLVEAIVVGASDAHCKFYSPQHVYNPNSNSTPSSAANSPAPSPSPSRDTSRTNLNAPPSTSPPRSTSPISASPPSSTSPVPTSPPSASPPPSTSPTPDGTSETATSAPAPSEGNAAEPTPNASAAETTPSDANANAAATTAASTTTTTSADVSSSASNADVSSNANNADVSNANTSTNNGAASNGTKKPEAIDLVMKTTTAEAAGYFKKDAEWYHSKMVMKKGIDVGNIEVMLHVRILEGMESEQSGARSKKFSKEETQWPYQLHMPMSCLADDTRYIEIASPTLEKRFPAGAPVIYMGPQYTGALGQVECVTGNTLIVSVFGNQSEPRFGAKIAQQTAETYYPLYMIARRLNVSTRNLSKVTGSVYFEPGRFNLGLNIKFSGKNLQVPGYTRKVGDAPWEFTERAIQIIADYKAKFPRVFELLDQGEDPYNTSDLLPGNNNKTLSTTSPTPLRTSANGLPTGSSNSTAASGTPSSDGAPQQPSDAMPKPEGDAAKKDEKEEEQPTAHKIAKEIQTWLRGLPTDNIPKVPCGCDAMTSDGIKQVESYVAKLNAPMRKKILRNVDPADVTTPRDDELSFLVPFSIGDRVVYALDNTPVPFGLRGTVVASKGKTLDVLFDSDFIGGNTLDGNCSDFRGKNVSANAVYNITRYNGKPHSPAPSPAPPARQAWNTNNNNTPSRPSPHQSPHQSPSSFHSPPTSRQGQQRQQSFNASPHQQQQKQPSFALLQQQAQQQQRQSSQQNLAAQQQNSQQNLAAQQNLPTQQQQKQPSQQNLAAQQQNSPTQQQQHSPNDPRQQQRGGSNRNLNKPQKEYKPKSPPTTQQQEPQQPAQSAQPQSQSPPPQQEDSDDLARLWQKLMIQQPSEQQPPQPAQPHHNNNNQQKQYRQKAPQPQQPQQPQQSQPQTTPQQPQQPQQPQPAGQPLQARQQRSLQRQQQKQQKQQQQQQQLQQPPQQQQPAQPQQPQQSQQPVQTQQPAAPQHQYVQQQPQQSDPKDALTWQQQLLQPPGRGGRPGRNLARNDPRGAHAQPHAAPSVLAPPAAVPAVLAPAVTPALYNPNAPSHGGHHRNAHHRPHHQAHQHHQPLNAPAPAQQHYSPLPPPAVAPVLNPNLNAAPAPAPSNYHPHPQQQQINPNLYAAPPPAYAPAHAQAYAPAPAYAPAHAQPAYAPAAPAAPAADMTWQQQEMMSGRKFRGRGPKRYTE